MAERSLRGSSIGSKSLESESGVEFAPRVEATYDLPDGRVVVVPFSAEADIPPVWETPTGEGLLRNAERPEDLPGKKKQRTHWDMLLERRTRAELQELLDERLDLLRSGRLRRRSA